MIGNFIWNSRKDKTLSQEADQWLPTAGDRLIVKG